MTEIDQSGTFLRFVQGKCEKNLLWVTGPGNSGKTTLIRTVRDLYPGPIFTIDLSVDFLVLPKFVLIANEKLDHVLLNSVVTSHPTTRFIVESSFLPHEDLICEILPLTKRFR